MQLAWVLLLVGCGRLGFETSRDGAMGDDEDGAVGDGPMNNPDAMDMTVTFGEMPTADFMGVTRDTFISQDVANANYGAADNIRLEKDNGERGLIAFRVVGIPTSAVVLAASVRFYVEVATAGAVIQFHRVNEQWDEGDVDGANGVANFTFRMGLIPWSLAGAYPPSIGASIGMFAGDVMGAVDVELPVALVHGWVTNPGSNEGILMESTSDQTVRLVSSEGPSSMRPVLTVTYE